MDFVTLKPVIIASGREGVRCAIFGVAASNLYGLARFTEDMNLCLEPTAEIFPE